MLVFVQNRGEAHGAADTVMELLNAETLAQWMGRQALEIGELLDLEIQVADALESAHSKGIVHRDLSGRRERRAPG